MLACAARLGWQLDMLQHCAEMLVLGDRDVPKTSFWLLFQKRALKETKPSVILTTKNHTSIYLLKSDFSVIPVVAMSCC